MLGQRHLEIINYDVMEKVYDQNNQLKGYMARIILDTYIDKEFNWINELCQNPEMVALHQENDLDVYNNAEYFE